MATMNTVIEHIDSVKPNVYSDQDKYRWMAKLDGMVSLEVLCQEEPKTYELPRDADTELLIPPPFDDVYGVYVAAMIDFYNREYSGYNNSVLMFTERFEAYKAWYIRGHAHGKARNFRNVMG